jgi:hypothetical protein
MNLDKNILSTIAYYDVFNYPLTSFEVWKYLLSWNAERETEDNKEKISLADVCAALDSEEIKKHIEECRGFYFLKGRQALVEQRIERNKISETKYEIVGKAVFWLRLVPYVRMIGVTGRLAMKNAVSASDLDLLIVIKKGRMFTGRLLVTFMAQMIGRRRYAEKIADRVCLNYYIADCSLSTDLKDLYSSSEYSFIMPVYGFGMFQEFQKQNVWIRKYRANFRPDAVGGLRIVEDSGISRTIKQMLEFLLDHRLLEAGLKKWQMRRIVRDPRTCKAGSAVTANDDTLIFLPDPQGPEVFQRFQERMESLS